MTKYEEMTNAAKEARIAYGQYRERSWRNLWAIVGGLEDLCGVPQDKIVYLKWNGEYVSFDVSSDRRLAVFTHSTERPATMSKMIFGIWDCRFGYLR